MAKDFRPLDGVLLLDKPLHQSSNTALQKARRLFRAEKAGHTGTLDPMATGLLPVCFGEATKYSSALLEADKTYRATMRLGITTTTGDSEGDILSERPVVASSGDIAKVLQQYTGAIQQLPPMHSALKHQGKPLYDYIRKGVTVERRVRDVVIHELTLNGFSNSEMDITVRCSKGTYIRTLAEDIGGTLGCGAHLSALRRLSIAHLNLQDAHSLESLQSMDEDERERCLQPIESLIPELPILTLDAVEVRRISQGQRLSLTSTGSGLVRLHGPEGFIGTGTVEGGRLSPARLLSSVALRAARSSGENGVK